MLILYLATIDDPDQKSKFEYVYNNYFHFMRQTAYSVLRSSDLAEEAVHDSFLQILKEIDSLRIDNDHELKAYLYILTHERSIDFLRRWERKKGLITYWEPSYTNESIQEPEHIAITHIQLEQAIKALSNMPVIYRRALTLRVKGYSIKEIAQITQSSEANVKSRIHRARKTLLKIFEEETPP